jgi:hypothetical protein
MGRRKGGSRKARLDRHFDGARKRDGSPPPRSRLVDEELADRLLGKAQAEGVVCSGLMGCFPR